MSKKGATKRYFSKEYKLSVAKKNIDGENSGKLSKELGLDKSLICHWARADRDEKEAGLETKRHPGNPLPAYQKRKEMAVEDQPPYELAKKDIGLAKLKNC